MHERSFSYIIFQLFPFKVVSNFLLGKKTTKKISEVLIFVLIRRAKVQLFLFSSSLLHYHQCSRQIEWQRHRNEMRKRGWQQYKQEVFSSPSPRVLWKPLFFWWQHLSSPLHSLPFFPKTLFLILIWASNGKRSISNSCFQLLFWSYSSLFSFVFFPEQYFLPPFCKPDFPLFLVSVFLWFDLFSLWFWSLHFVSQQF